MLADDVFLPAKVLDAVLFAILGLAPAELMPATVCLASNVKVFVGATLIFVLISSSSSKALFMSKLSGLFDPVSLAATLEFANEETL